MDGQDIKSCNIAEIENIISKYNAPKFHAKQIFSWLHKNVKSFDEMSDLPKDLREKLKIDYNIYTVTIRKKNNQVRSDSD